LADEVQVVNVRDFLIAVQPFSIRKVFLMNKRSSAVGGAVFHAGDVTDNLRSL